MIEKVSRSRASQKSVVEKTLAVVDSILKCQHNSALHRHPQLPFQCSGYGENRIATGFFTNGVQFECKEEADVKGYRTRILFKAKSPDGAWGDFLCSIRRPVRGAFEYCARERVNAEWNSVSSLEIAMQLSHQVAEVAEALR